MKILFDSYNCCRQNQAGGVQNKILDLYNCLTQKKVNVTLFNKWEHKVENFDVLHLFKVSSEYLGLIQYAKSKGIMIVLSAIIPLAGRKKIKADLLLCRLFHLHTANYFTKRIFNIVDVIVTETEKEKQFIIDVFNIEPTKICVIPNGISLDFNAADEEMFCEHYGISKSFVIQVGRIDQNKNLLSVIKALKGSGIELVVVGGPAPDEIDYFEECKRISDETVHYVGWIKHDDPMLVSALKAAKVLVLPSHKEIFGNAVFEGAMAGNNIVLTKELPCKEWGMEDKFYVIDPDNVDDIKAKLLEAYSHPVDIDIVKDVKMRYSIDAISVKHIELYGRLIK